MVSRRRGTDKSTTFVGCDITEPIAANCYPFTWTTFPEVLENAGVSWQVWQNFDNFEDNMLAYFQQYKAAPNGSALREKGISFPGLDAFYEAAAKGTLPAVSYIVGPQELSEHPPNMPQDGAWLQEQVVKAVMNSPKYNETALIISYDGEILVPSLFLCLSLFLPPLTLTHTHRELVPADMFAL